MNPQFPYRITNWLKDYPDDLLQTFKKYKEMKKCLVIKKRNKYAIFTTGELLLPYEGKGKRTI